jgi:hypothetical protein
MAHICSTRSSGVIVDAAAAVALIDGLPVLVHARRPAVPAWAPPGYDDVDVRVLDWIASHRIGRPPRFSA